MTRLARLFVSSTIVFGAAACADVTSSPPSSLSLSALGAALSTVPVGFGDLATSYIGESATDAGTGSLWIGGGADARFDRGERDHGGFMGGGIQDAFVGGIAFDGRGGRHGPFSGGLACSGTFDAASGRVVCADATRNGVTVKRSAKYTDASGAVQQSFDSLTTNTVSLPSQVAGTITFDRAADSLDDRDGHGDHHWGRGRGAGGRLLGDTSTILTATTTVGSSSSRTVSGLAQNSTQRTVEGASAGTESTVGTSSRGSFTATRAAGDTTVGLVIPVAVGTKSYPTAGTVIRQIQATLKYSGEDAVALSRREVVTYDGSATAKVVITQDGTTKTCTRPLPRGPLTCS
jgi:hypothetical protein